MRQRRLIQLLGWKACWLILLPQLIVTIVLMIFFRDKHGVFDLASGALASMLPSVFFAWRCFRQGLIEAKVIVRAIYVAELQKLLLTALLVVIFIGYFHVNVVAFFVGFVGAQIAIWVSPLMGYLVERKARRL